MSELTGLGRGAVAAGVGFLAGGGLGIGNNVSQHIYILPIRGVEHNSFAGSDPVLINYDEGKYVML